MLPSFTNLVVYIITVNIHVQVLCRCKFSTPLGKYQGAQLLDHMVRVFLVLKETAKMSSKVAEPFCIPVFSEWVFLLFYILTSIWCCQCFRFPPFPQAMEVSSLYWFGTSLWGMKLNIFPYAYLTSAHLLVWCPDLWLFLNWMFLSFLDYFFIAEFHWVHWIFWMSGLYQICRGFF